MVLLTLSVLAALGGTALSLSSSPTHGHAIDHSNGRRGETGAGWCGGDAKGDACESDETRAVATRSARVIVNEFPTCESDGFSWHNHVAGAKPRPGDPTGTVWQSMAAALLPIFLELEAREEGLFALSEFAGFGDSGRVPFMSCNAELIFLCGRPLCKHTDALFNGGFPSLALFTGFNSSVCVDRNVWYRTSIVLYEGRHWVPMLYDGGPNDLTIDMMLLNEDGTCEYTRAVAPTSAHASLRTVGYLPYIVSRVLSSAEHPGHCAVVVHARGLGHCPRRDADNEVVSSQDIIAASQLHLTAPGPTGVACYSAKDGLSTFHGWQHVHWIEGTEPRVYAFSKNETNAVLSSSANGSYVDPTLRALLSR